MYRISGNFRPPEIFGLEHQYDPSTYFYTRGYPQIQQGFSTSLTIDRYLTVSRCALIRIPAHREYENIQDEKFIIENFLLQNTPEIQYVGCSVARDN